MCEWPNGMIPSLLYCADRSLSSDVTCTWYPHSKESMKTHTRSQLRLSGVNSKWNSIVHSSHQFSLSLKSSKSPIRVCPPAFLLWLQSPGLPGNGCVLPGHNQLPTPGGCPDTPTMGASLLLWLEKLITALSPRSSQLFRNEGHAKKNLQASVQSFEFSVNTAWFEWELNLVLNQAVSTVVWLSIVTT